MISIKKSEIPEYLRNSVFYNNLEDNDELIDIPKFKINDITENLSDFKNLINSIMFFDAEFPKSVKKYYYKNSHEIIDYYLIYKKESSYEIMHLFKYLFKLKIKSLEQFICNFIMITKLKFEASEEYIEYGLNNRDLFLKKYKNLYLEISDEKPIERAFIIMNNSFHIPNTGKYIHINHLDFDQYIYLVYKELKETFNFNFLVEILLIAREPNYFGINLNFLINIDNLRIGKFIHFFEFKSFDDCIKKFETFRDTAIMDERLFGISEIFYSGDFLLFKSKEMQIDMLITEFNKKNIYDSFDLFVKNLVKIKEKNNL